VSFLNRGNVALYDLMALSEQYVTSLFGVCVKSLWELIYVT